MTGRGEMGARPHADRGLHRGGSRRPGTYRVYLETNSGLAPALGLYRSAGFVDLPAQPTSYARCDVWMELRF